MRRVSSVFALEVFDRRNAKSPRLADYLDIYVSNFGHDHRTKTNELLDFLANPPDDRKIVYFGLTYRGIPCGFAVFMVFESEGIAVIDHLVIAPNSRGHGSFFVFADLIVTYLESKHDPIEYFVAEVVLDHDHSVSAIKPELLMRLMRLIGFKVAKVRYWAPDPLIIQDRDACRAALMIATQPDRSRLPVPEFVRIVRLVFHRHYGDWYQRARPEIFDEYGKATEAALADIENLVAKERTIILNGMKDSDLRTIVSHPAAPDLPVLGYILLLSIPAVVGAAVAFKQDLITASTSALVTLLILVICLCVPRLRRPLFRFFQLRE